MSSHQSDNIAARSRVLSTADSQDQPGLAIASVAAGVCLLTVTDVIAKTLTTEMSPFYFVFLRSFFAFIPVLVVIHYTRTWTRLRTRRPVEQMARGLAMAVAYTLYLQALRDLPLADATAIVFSAPVLVALLSRAFLGETVPLIRWVAILIGFAGAVVIIQPGSESFRPAGLWALGAAIAVAISALLARRLGTTEPSSVTSFYTTIAFLFMGLVPVVMIPELIVPLDAPRIALIGLAGLIAGTAHFLVIYGYRRGEASLVAPFEYSSLLFAIAFGYVFFGDFPTTLVVVGIGLVALAGILLARR